MATDTRASLSDENLRDLANSIADNPDEIYELDHAKLVEMRRFINPLGGIVTSKKCFVNMSITNWTERCHRRFYTTAMIGYIYRTLEEYEPTEELDREDKRYRAALEKLGGEDVPEIRKKLLAEHEAMRETMINTARRICRSFLNRNFDFNPDIHIRGAHTKSPGERKTRTDGMREAKDAAEAANAAKAKLTDDPDRAYKFLRSHVLTTYQEVLQASSAIKTAADSLIGLTAGSGAVDPADVRQILLRKHAILEQHLAKLAVIAKPMATADSLPTWTVEPPVNVFHQFDRYVVNHYEQLRDVVTALYEERFDIEFSVTLYDAFKTAEAAREHRIQHNDEFRNEVYTIENGPITLLGPFKENRDKVDMYNKNTEILKRMNDQLEQDHKIGADFVHKKIDAKKRKNIEEAGPDDPALAAYAKTMNVAASLGAEKMFSKEDAEKYAEAVKQARNIKEDYEVPDGAIQMDVFFSQEVDGKTVLGRKKMYTQAEKPTFLQDQSRANEEYQPVREDPADLDGAYTTRVITSRTGEKKTIKVPKKSLDPK